MDTWSTADPRWKPGLGSQTPWSQGPETDTTQKQAAYNTSTFRQCFGARFSQMKPLTHFQPLSPAGSEASLGSTTGCTLLPMGTTQSSAWLAETRSSQSFLGQDHRQGHQTERPANAGPTDKAPSWKLVGEVSPKFAKPCRLDKVSPRPSDANHGGHCRDLRQHWLATSPPPQVSVHHYFWPHWFPLRKQTSHPPGNARQGSQARLKPGPGQERRAGGAQSATRPPLRDVLRGAPAP